MVEKDAVAEPETKKESTTQKVEKIEEMEESKAKTEVDMDKP